MAAIQIVTKGLAALQANMHNATQIIHEEITAGMRRACNVYWRAVAKYPAVGTPPGGSGLFNKRTGNLGRSFTIMVSDIPGGVKGVVGTNLSTIPYARWVNEGTGIYGPKGQRIYAKNGGVLAIPVMGGGIRAAGPFLTGARGGAGRPRYNPFAAKGKGNVIFRRSIAGMKGWHFIERATAETEDQITTIFDQAGTRAARRLLAKEGA